MSKKNHLILLSCYHFLDFRAAIAFSICIASLKGTKSFIKKMIQTHASISKRFETINSLLNPTINSLFTSQLRTADLSCGPWLVCATASPSGLALARTYHKVSDVKRGRREWFTEVFCRFCFLLSLHPT